MDEGGNKSVKRIKKRNITEMEIDGTGAGNHRGTRADSKRLREADDTHSGVPAVKKKTGQHLARDNQIDNTDATKIVAEIPHGSSSLNATTKATVSDDRSASEKALSNDVIVMSLFQYLATPTLKICRLVSKQWKHLGATELQRQPGSIKLNFGHFIDRSVKSARSLIALMKKTDNFPRTSFKVSSCELSAPRVQHLFAFLSKDSRMKKLTLTLDYKGKTSPFETSTMMVDLQNILLLVAPYLDFLKLEFLVPDHWTEEFRAWKPTSGSVGELVKLVKFPKLVEISFFGTVIPQKFFDDLMDSAVNLQRFEGPYFPGNLFEYFLSGNGRFRIHVLTNLIFTLSEEFIETMERLISQHKHNIKLRILQFYNFPSWDSDPEVLSRAALVLNQLLFSSSSSLNVFGLSPIRFLPGLVIPRLLKVDIVILYFRFADDRDNYFFPEGLNFNNIFPSVYSVGLHGDLSTDSIQFLDIAEPAHYVQHARISGQQGLASEELEFAMRGKFPNIEIISYAQES